MDKPLYRFRLNTEDGSIEVKEITEYVEWPSCYRYRGSGQYNYARKKHIDKMYCNGVYSFDPDPDHAKEIIIAALSEKAADLYAQYKHINNLLYELKGEGRD